MIKDVMEENENLLPNEKEMQVLKENFPACFKNDGTFDIERFKEYLSDRINVTNEGYELKFLGKNYARLLASMDTTTVITPDEEHNNKPENKKSENIYISGDNLDGLKHLLKSYAGQIKCIYIDPPYNTGSDGFVYNDSFDFTVEELSTKLSIDEEHAKRILDLTKRGSASHSAWLMFMYPRLLLARDLLKEDGVIFISIDDNEQANLKLLCDDVFGEENFVGIFTINSTPNARDYGHMGKMHDYVIFYTNKPDKAETYLIPELDKKFKFSDENSGFNVHPLYNSNEAFTNENRPNLYYPFYLYPETKKGCFYDIGLEKKEGSIEIYPPKSQKNNVQFVWRWGKEKAAKYMNTEIIGYLTEENEYRVVQKMRHSAKLIRSILVDKNFTSRKGTAEVEELLGEKIFSFPKPVSLIKTLYDAGITDDGIVLDFFSGSATSAEAVMRKNIADSIFNSNIKYILIQIDENFDELLNNSSKEEDKKKYQKIIDFLDSVNRPHTLDQIGIERIIRASNKIQQENPTTTADLGFKHYTLKEVTEDTLDKLEEFNPNEQGLLLNNDLLHEFGSSTILTTWLVRDGYGFNGKVVELDFAGYKAYWCDKHLYLINPELSKDAIAKIVEKFELDGNFNPENVVLFGYSFLWSEIDELKINLNRLKETEKNLRINYDVRY